MARIGLYFGSFNPIHYGHLLVAQEALCNKKEPIDEVWFVVSPQNPQKDKSELADFLDRCAMVFMSIRGTKEFSLCDIEDSLSIPSYTYNTLNALKDKFFEHEFLLIMGSDNYLQFHTWKNVDDIIKNHKILIIERGQSDCSWAENNKVTVLKETSNLSSTEIRKRVKDGKPIKFYTHPEVVEYIQQQNLYK